MTDFIEQRSPQWFEQRKCRITGSAVGAILGNSPYMTQDDVMRALVRDREGAEREFQGNIATEWGTQNEARAIMDFTMETGLNVRPATFIQIEDWGGASPDGYTSDKGLIEVKCPYSMRHGGEYKSIKEQPHYYDQMQFQMIATGERHCHFWQWSPYDFKHEIVDYDQEWADKNMPILRQFYARFLSEEAAEHIAPKRITVDTPEAHKMAAEYDELSEAIELATERRKELLAQMADMAGEKDALFAGRKLTKVQKAGAVSYAAVVKKHCAGVDLEPFRGKASSHWKFT